MSEAEAKTETQPETEPETEPETQPETQAEDYRLDESEIPPQETAPRVLSEILDRREAEYKSEVEFITIPQMKELEDIIEDHVLSTLLQILVLYGSDIRYFRRAGAGKCDGCSRLSRYITLSNGLSRLKRGSCLNSQDG